MLVFWMSIVALAPAGVVYLGAVLDAGQSRALHAGH